VSPSATYYSLRSRLANSSKTTRRDDPKLNALRAEVAEAYVVHKVAQVIERGPAMTPYLRDRLAALVSDLDVRAAA